MYQFSQDNSISDDLKLRLLRYFVDNNFGGYYNRSDPETRITEQFNKKIFKKESFIRDFSVYLSFLCLSVNISKPDLSEGLNKIIKVAFDTEGGTLEELLTVTAFIIGETACKQNNKDLSKAQELKGLDFQKAFDRVNLRRVFETLRGIMFSPIINNEDYEFIKGPMLSTVKGWIDKACYAEIIKAINVENDLALICIELLKDQFTLDDFWKNDF